eukprot:scaffold79385_cov64-Phaeocystis_antarctica.AAC.9
MLSAAGLGLAGGLRLSSLGLGKLCGLSVGVLERLPAKLPPEETGVAPHQVGVGHLAEGGGLLLAPSRLRLLLLLLLGRRPMALLATVELVGRAHLAPEQQLLQIPSLGHYQVVPVRTYFRRWLAHVIPAPQVSHGVRSALAHERME